MAAPVLELKAGARTAYIVATSVAEGDLAISSSQPGLEARRRKVVDLPWTWMHQVHGATVVRVTQAGEGAGVDADAAVTATPAAVLAVQVADCAPVALVGSDGIVGIAHVGWRGLVAGTIRATVDAMGSRELRGALYEAHLLPLFSFLGGSTLSRSGYARARAAAPTADS